MSAEHEEEKRETLSLPDQIRASSLNWSHTADGYRPRLTLLNENWARVEGAELESQTPAMCVHVGDEVSLTSPTNAGKGDTSIRLEGEDGG